MSWDETALCSDADLIEFETNVLAWTGSEGGCAKWIGKAKDQIAQKLRFAFKAIEATLDLDDDTDILDLILDVTPLKDAACYRSLYLLCRDCSTGADAWSEKAEAYKRDFEEAWSEAIGLISLDTDESGEIDDGEKYNVPGITFTRSS